MNKKQMINMLGAGTVTGLILALVMLLSGGDAPAEAQSAVPVMVTNTPGVTEVVPLENYDQLQADYDTLSQNLQTMQDREAQYQVQLEQANQLLAQPQNEMAEGGEYEEYGEEEAYEEEEAETYEEEEEEEEYEDD